MMLLVKLPFRFINSAQDSLQVLIKLEKLQEDLELVSFPNRNRQELQQYTYSLLVNIIFPGETSTRKYLICNIAELITNATPLQEQ